MTEITETLTRLRETKTKVVYATPNTRLGTLYLDRDAAAELGSPDAIKVTVEVAG